MRTRRSISDRNCCGEPQLTRIRLVLGIFVLLVSCRRDGCLVVDAASCSDDDDCNGGLCVMPAHDEDFADGQGHEPPPNFCSCPQGYGGTNCETKCNLNCQNNGICHVHEGTGSDGDHAGNANSAGEYCQCVGNFEGLLCETPYEICPDTSLCFAGGKCVKYNDGSGVDQEAKRKDKQTYRCFCPADRDGDLCENERKENDPHEAYSRPDDTAKGSPMTPTEGKQGEDWVYKDQAGDAITQSDAGLAKSTADNRANDGWAGAAPIDNGSASSSDKPNRSVIKFGVAIVILALVVMGAVVLYCCWRKCNKQKNLDNVGETEEQQRDHSHPDSSEIQQPAEFAQII